MLPSPRIRICKRKISITMLQSVITSHTKLYLKQCQREQPRDTYMHPLHLSATYPRPPSVYRPRSHPYQDTAYFVPYHTLLYRYHNWLYGKCSPRHICNSYVRLVAFSFTFIENRSHHLSEIALVVILECPGPSYKVWKHIETNRWYTQATTRWGPLCWSGCACWK